MMGFGCGFDICPRLEVTAENKETYQRFLDEIIDTYKDAYDPEARRDDGKVLEMPEDTDNPDRAYIMFMVGECPHLPNSPDHCDYFLRFSSKISGRLTAPAEPYIRDVRKIAKKHFGNRVHPWHGMNETDDQRQWGCYGWEEVNGAHRKLWEMGKQQSA